MSDEKKIAKTQYISVNRLWKKSGIVEKEEASEEPIEVPMAHEGALMAEVGFGNRLTLNMGNYETIQLSVDVRLPCYVTELDAALKAAKGFVDAKMAAESAPIRKHREEKGKR